MPRPEKHPHAEEVRLQAFLAHSGVASRRAAEDLIAAGQVFVNGKSVTAPGTKIRPGVDQVEVQGQPVEVQPPTWLALHKPKGYVTTRLDPYGRKTVYELIPEKYHGLFHVGRLDRDSEGLLLLTNQGELANRMLHPSFGVTKEYWADVEGKPTAEEMHRLTEGVEADGEVMHAESVRRLHQTAENQHRLSVVMREGKKREVRRMLEAIGHPVARLIRRRFGPVSIGELKPGKWRVLAEAELSALRDPAKRPSRPARLHSGEGDEAASAVPGGERRPQRKPKPGERAAAADRAGKPAAGAGAAPRPSERRLKARDEAPRGRHGDGKPRRGPQERDERPFHERGTGGPAKRGPAKRVREGDDHPPAAFRGPVKRVRDDEHPTGGSRGAAKGGPVKRARAGDDRPAASRGAPARTGPPKRGRDDDERPSAAPSARDREAPRGPSPREASRGFPRAGRAKPGGGARPQGGAREGKGDDDREMESSYPQTRRGSARPSPRGGAPDERRGAPDRPQAKRGRGSDERPDRGGGKPARGGKDAHRPHGRDRDDDAGPRPPSPRGGGDRPRAGKGPGGPPKRSGGGGPSSRGGGPGGAKGPGGPRQSGPRKGGGPRGRR